MEWKSMITERVRTLVALLGSPNKSPYFRAPDCIGNFLDHSTDDARFGLVYTKPAVAPRNAPPTSLLSLLTSQTKPSLTQGLALATTLARSVMYVHSVNWLHKCLRSNNIVFFLDPNLRHPVKPSYTSPIISGFEYARIDRIDEYTEPVPEHSENDIYRHPQTLTSMHLWSKKSHDMYSLGIVLLEIAYWQSAAQIVKLPKDERGARRMLRGVRELLLTDEHMDVLEGLVGDVYADAVRKCLGGLVAHDADEENPVVGAQIQCLFHDEVVAKLGSTNA